MQPNTERGSDRGAAAFALRNPKIYSGSRMVMMAFQPCQLRRMQYPVLLAACVCACACACVCAGGGGGGGGSGTMHVVIGNSRRASRIGKTMENLIHVPVASRGAEEILAGPPQSSATGAVGLVPSLKVLIMASSARAITCPRPVPAR